MSKEKLPEGYVSFAEKIPTEGMRIDTCYIDKWTGEIEQQGRFTMTAESIDYIKHFKRHCTDQFWRQVKEGGSYEN